jgi:hypothetical protein
VTALDLSPLTLTPSAVLAANSESMLKALAATAQL